MELKLLGRRGDHLCTPGDKSSVRQQGINQSGQGEVETEKKEEINTGAGQEPKVGEGMESVNQKSGKRSKDRQRVRNAPVEGQAEGRICRLAQLDTASISENKWHVEHGLWDTGMIMPTTQ